MSASSLPELSVRGRRPRDLPTLRRWLTDPAAEWRRWDAPYLPAGPTSRALAAYAEQLASAPPSPHERVLDLGGTCIGMVNRAEEDPAGGGWWDLGLLIYDPAHWGQGLGTRALALWVQATLDETDAHVLSVTTWGGHTAMQRAALRLGFREAGRVREARLVGDQRHDQVRLDLLRREWRAP